MDENDLLTNIERDPHTNIERITINTLSSEHDVVRGIDERLLKSKDANEIILWTGIRKEIIKQNESLERPKHKRKFEAINVYFKMGLSTMAFIAGVILLVYGYVLLAPFIIGAGLFSIAPEFVMKYFTDTKGGNDE